MKIQLCHDYFEFQGGGENLIQQLSQHLNAPIATGFINPKLNLDYVNTDTINSLNAYRGFRPFQILSLINRWEHYQNNQASHLIYSGMYSLCASKQHQEQKNILYCNTPPRFVYDQKNYYLSQLPAWQRPALNLLAQYVKNKYESALPHLDAIIANSKHIQKRIKDYLQLESKVIYPPCDTQRFQYQASENFFLSTARLDSLKRIDIIIEAFKKMPSKRLIVASNGPELSSLQQLASNAPNITFTGWLSNTQLNDLINRCLATIYIPSQEDYGISPVESMAAGKPVIGVSEGGLAETIVDGVSGYLINTQELSRNEFIEALCDKVIILETQAINMRKDCEQRARLFNQQRFFENMQQLLKSC